jgi:hypothetical protein
MGALSTRHSLRPLFILGGKFLQTSDGSRRENADTCHVIASAAKQSIFLDAATWIASLRSQ